MAYFDNTVVPTNVKRKVHLFLHKRKTNYRTQKNNYGNLLVILKSQRGKATGREVIPSGVCQIRGPLKDLAVFPEYNYVFSIVFRRIICLIYILS